MSKYESLTDTGTSYNQRFVFTNNVGQSILDKYFEVRNFCKQVKKFLLLRNLSQTLTKFWFWRGDWAID